jgi:molybdopterin synthase catalytic subunit
MIAVKVQSEAFDPGEALSGFCQGVGLEAGGVASFTGLARADQGQTLALELEAYLGFTEPWIEALTRGAVERFGLTRALVIHRTGPIRPGEAIVFVAAAARHRRQAFEATDYLMDHLKSRAPFWKKEHGPDGARWIEPRPADYHDLLRWDGPASGDTNQG